MGVDIHYEIHYGIDVTPYMKLKETDDNKDKDNYYHHHDDDYSVYINDIGLTNKLVKKFNIDYVFDSNSHEYMSNNQYIVSGETFTFNVVRCNDDIIKFINMYNLYKDALYTSGNTKDISRFCEYFGLDLKPKLIEIYDRD